MELDEGKVVIKKINTSSKTLEDSLKTYKDYAGVQDTSQKEHEQRDNEETKKNR